jgi:hypothetical protein
VSVAYQYAQYSSANGPISAKRGVLLRYFFGKWDFFAIVRRVDAMCLLALSAIRQFHPIFLLLNWSRLSIEDICRRSLCCVALANPLPDAGKTMDGVAQATVGVHDDSVADARSSPDFGFVPQNLRSQCRSLIESYHSLHGFGSLPNILWKAGLGPFIETHREFRQLLRKASTTRSAKKSNDGFAQIATTLLSLEILSSNFAGWSTLYPQAASAAKSILKRHSPLAHTPLMESYLYPPKHISSAAIATLAPPTRHDDLDADTSNASPSSSDLHVAGRSANDMSPMTASPLQT